MVAKKITPMPQGAGQYLANSCPPSLEGQDLSDTKFQQKPNQRHPIPKGEWYSGPENRRNPEFIPHIAMKIPFGF